MEVIKPTINAGFWDDLFEKEMMPWDQLGVPPLLTRYLEQQTKRSSRVFIPGCGAAYEVALFAQLGYEIMAMDYSKQAVEKAKKQLGSYAEYVHQGDVFKHTFSDAFNLIYERAFLAALPKVYWPNYFAMLDNLLESGGLVVGFFIISEHYKSRFPPYCLMDGELETKLSDKFELVECKKVANSVEVFADKEYWMVWRKK